MGYFRELPNIQYQTLFGNKTPSSDDYILAKNLFRRGKLIDEAYDFATIFTKYEIEEGERPDIVAEKLYGSSDLDWVVLVTAGIIHVRDEWPLSSYQLYNYAENKYGTELNAIKFYQTEEVKDSSGRLILPEGKIVDKDFTITYFDTIESNNNPDEFEGETVFISETYNDLPVRGFLYYPTSESLGSEIDVVVLYHPTIETSGANPITSSQRFLNTALNPEQLNIKDKIIFSVAYPQDAIPDWISNPSLASEQFPGIDIENFYLGDNLEYAEAALLWVKNELDTYFITNGIQKSIRKVFTFGHSQGGSLVHKLNTMYQIDGVISNAPGPIDLLDRCSRSEATGENNFSCRKIRLAKGSTTTNPSVYNSVSLTSYLTGTLSPSLFTQALDDTTYQVEKMKTVFEPRLNLCLNCADITFNYYESGRHPAFETNPVLQRDIRNFIGSISDPIVNTPYGRLITKNPVVAVSNYEYEVKKNAEKSTIFVLRREYLQQFLNDMRDIMIYTPSSQYVDDNTLKTENTKVTLP